VFGSKANVRLENKKIGLTKLGPQSESGIFLGMEPNTQAYRVLIGSEIRVSRHVVFSKKKFNSDGNVEGLVPIEHEKYDELSDVFEEEGYQALRDLRRDQPYLDPFLSAQFREARVWGHSHGRK
jgi:hypothetical protein